MPCTRDSTCTRRSTPVFRGPMEGHYPISPVECLATQKRRQFDTFRKLGTHNGVAVVTSALAEHHATRTSCFKQAMARPAFCQVRIMKQTLFWSAATLQHRHRWGTQRRACFPPRGHADSPRRRRQCTATNGGPAALFQRGAIRGYYKHLTSARLLRHAGGWDPIECACHTHRSSAPPRQRHVSNAPRRSTTFILNTRPGGDPVLATK